MIWTMDETPQAENLTQPEYEALLKRLEELEALKERFMRSAADFENAKKRLLKERDEFAKFSQERLLRDLLPILDNFERAFSHIPENSDKNFKAVLSGMEMVYKQLAETLKNHGLKKLKTVGEKFDPHLHEAVAFSHDFGPEDRIVEEVESGYLLLDRLLRAAKVKVRMPAPSSGSAQEKQEEIT